MIKLKGRTEQKEVSPEKGYTLLDLALKYDIDWAFSCTQGNCARCRCLIEEGMEYLNEPTDNELDRLEPEEIEEGYRLGCQAKIIIPGNIVAVNQPYF